MRLSPGVARVLPLVAVAFGVVVVGAILASAGPTLGADAKAYLGAARRLLGGQPLYDTTYTSTGPPELFDYPPPFVLAALPFALLPDPLAVLSWTAALIATFAVGVVLLPVSRDVRWLIVLLAGVSWPFAYAIKLGQVEPILFVVFAAGWRWLDRPGPFGVAAAVGTIVKAQPALLFAWALLTRRWRAVLVGLSVLLLVAAAVTLVVGTGAWLDWITLIRKISAPVTADHSFTPGAIAYQLGASETVGTAIQAASTLAALGLVVLAALRFRPDVSYMTAVTASQLVSPILWDHYAMLLLLPTALLLERGQWWAMAIPLATSVVAIWAPPAIYPVSFWVALAAPLLVEFRGRADAGPNALARVAPG